MKRVRLVTRTTIYRGRIIRLIREVLEVNGQRLIRETVKHPGAVVIVPLSGAICDAKTIIGVLFAQRLLRRSRRPS